MSSLKSIINTFMLMSFAVMVASCVPKATEKKAVCGADEAFNSVTRSCYSISQVRQKPVGTKASEVLNEETPKTITLTYTDGNKDVANSCKISAISAGVEVMSPVLLSGSLFTQADDVSSAAVSLAYNMGETLLMSNIDQSLMAAKNSFYYTTVNARMSDFKMYVDNAIALAAGYSNPTLSNLSTITKQRLAVLAPLLDSLNNRCECSAGVCTTTVVPKLHKSGAASFVYSITDADGEGSGKSVALTINAMSATTSHLAPVAGSGYAAFSENNTSDRLEYTFSLPGAADLSGISSTIAYSFVGSTSTYTRMSVTGVAGKTTYGRVIDCMGFMGSSGANDTSCTYIPDSGDTNSGVLVAAKAAAPMIDDVTYTAVKEGTSGNAITIQYFDLQSNTTMVDPYATDAEKFGLVTPTTESFIRVSGNSIKVFVNPTVTTTAMIRSMINAHPQASRLVLAAGGSTALPLMSAHTLATSFAGGTDAFDLVTYKATNSLGASSSNTSRVVIGMTAVNDLPMIPKTYNPLFSQTLSMNEEQTKTLSLGFTDVDSYLTAFSYDVRIDPVGSVCSNIMTNAAFLFMGNSTNFTVTDPATAAVCSAAGVCTKDFTVQANLDFSGDACLYYTVTDFSGATSAVQPIKISVTGINDAPVITSAAITSPTVHVNEDLAAGLNSYVDAVITPGGGVFEATQTVAVTLESSDPTVIPTLTPCKNYTPYAGTPVNAIVPTASGKYYFDTVNYTCYVSTGTTANSYKLYPSLTAFPTCVYTSFQAGSPIGVITNPGSSGIKNLDTENNVCYVSDVSLPAQWKIDTSITNYKISYVPIKDRSSVPPINITIKAVDNGGTALGGINTKTEVFPLLVNFVPDPPFFISTITSIHTNEGGAVQGGPFKVDEDEGSTTDEDAEGITITSIVSDNPSLLPTSAISIFYDLNNNGVEDSGEARTIGSILEASAGDDAKLHNFYLKLDPIDGVAGNANITLTVNDGSGAAPTSTNFSFIVHPIAALHGGWDNISSVGIKTNKAGAPVSLSEMKCNYNKLADDKKCGNGTAACTGTSSPHSVVVPDTANVLYWDSSNQRCYRSTGSTVYSWVEMNTSCPVSRDARALTCLTTPDSKANNCIQSTSPVGTDLPGFVGQYVFDTADNSCYVSTGTTTGSWQAYVPSKVTLAWKPFLVSGTGPDTGVQVNAWNVYRREPGTDYDFKNGQLKDANSGTYSIMAPATRTFVDTTAIAGKVYFYVVRPVIRSVQDPTYYFPTYTPETFSEVRVLAPPANYAFVHRWMVNQEMCNGMNMTTTTTNNVDQTHNFRCPYKGPGESAVTAGYFDYGQDLLVDTQELGCAYATSTPATTKCTANGCIGIGAPNNAWNTGGLAAADDLYYDRGAGTCYRSNGTVWAEFDSAFTISGAVASTLNTALNAPLANITQARAIATCSARPVPTGTAVTFNGTNAVLPNKLDYSSYASQRIDMVDNAITELELGASLNLVSRCNGSSASGLETSFTDSNIPSTSFLFSLPGTFSSGIRSIYTGSVPVGINKGTEACVSRYGIQDLYGNVAEWTQDQMTCYDAAGDGDPTHTSLTEFSCVSKVGAGYSFKNTDFGIAADFTSTYAFNLKSGPFNDLDTTYGPSGSDGYLTSWVFEDEVMNAGKFSYPLAMPINTNINTDLASVNSNAASRFPFIQEIGPSSGITTNKLHQDGIIVNSLTIGAGGTGSFAVGGSYLSGNKAGRFTSELIKTTIKRPDVGLRCIVPILSYPADTKHTYPY